MSFTGLLVSKTEWTCLHYVSRQIFFFFFGQKFFSAGCIDSSHPALPSVLFLRPLITSKHLSVIVFLDFHFLVLIPSVCNSPLALEPSIVSRALSPGLLSLTVALIHLDPIVDTTPKAQSSSFFSLH